MDERFTGPADSPPPYLGATAPPGGMSERMQSLLSRAVEDQMAEQRQLQTLINDVRQSLAQLQEDVRQNAGAHTLDVVRGEVTGLASELRSSTSTLGDRLETFGTALAAVTGATGTLAQQLDRVVELLETHQQQLTALTSTLVQQQQHLAGLPDALGQRTEATADVVVAVREDVAALGTRLAAAQDTARTENADAVRRVAEHVDQAVLALAEALLRRRPGQPAPTPVPPPAPAMPVVSAPEPVVTPEPEATPEPVGEETEPAAETAEELAATPSEAEPADDDDASDAVEIGDVPQVERDPRAASYGESDDGEDGESTDRGDDPTTDTAAGADDVAEDTPDDDAPGSDAEPGADGADATDAEPAVTPEPATASAGDEEIEEFQLPPWTVDDGSDEEPAEAEPASESAWDWRPGTEPEQDTAAAPAEKRRPWWRPGG